MRKTAIITTLLLIPVLLSGLYKVLATHTDQTLRVTFTGNGTTTAFSFPHYVIDQNDLVVILRDTTTNVLTTQTLTTHYTVAGTGNAPWKDGVTVTMVTAPTSDEQLTILRNQPLEQDLDLVTGGVLPVETIERELDKIVMQIQRLNDKIERGLYLPDGFISADWDPTLPVTPTAGVPLLVNNDGDGWSFGTAASGTTLQLVNTTTNTQTNFTDDIPVDDTKPQISEGSEVLSLAITPTGVDNELHMTVHVVTAVATASAVTLALFQDTTGVSPDAIAAVSEYFETVDKMRTISLHHYMAAGTTANTTFSVRLGSDTDGITVTINGTAEARQFGGAASTSLTIREIAE